MDEPSKSTSKKSMSSSSKTKINVKKEKDEFSSDFLRQKLKEFFNHSDFKSSLQKDAIKEIMRGKRDVYISMPTGSGKSLCYQLPGMLHENKITIVFSPLIALIKDQMDHLTKLKICAESLNSKMTMKERERVINDLKSIRPNTKFLYITPEQAATEFFRSLLDSIVKYNKLALVAVDECHCVSEMGHQFRRDYLKLGELRKRYPTIKWIALTATASKDVTDDVYKQLALKEPKSFKTPCFRKNLFYEIIYKNSIQDDYIHLKEFALKCLKSKTSDEKPNNAPCGIIYCRTRDSVERVAIGLTKQNVATKAYHAGLNDKDRKEIQEDWTNGKYPVICATNSFGMGVDKASVRFVVHWDVPQNIAAYYQESGRAGRDGKQSICRLYYCRQEVKSITFLLNQQLQKDPDNVKSKRSVKEFDKLVEHCELLRCRHLLFSTYFGDQASDCKKRQLCDVCKDPKAAEKKLETFHRLSMMSYSSKMDVEFDSSDLYEGGRNAVQETEMSFAQHDDDDDNSSASSSKRDAKAGKETTNLIQKELERRRQKIAIAKKYEETQTRSFGIRIKSSIHTSKIAGLDVKKRESYLDYLLKALKENADKANEKPVNALKACDFEDIAAVLEYNCFTNNRVLAMYQKAMTNERLRIDRSTKNKELLTEIKNHIPKKRTAYGGSSEAMQRDLDDFMEKNNIANKSTTNSTNTQTPHTNGFQTARQINSKLKEPNRLKKDPLTQMSINKFFSATATIKREPEDKDSKNESDNESRQQAKRRRVDESELESSVRIKSEPMDTTEFNEEESTTLVNVKNEPLDYDSDCGTEKGSDDEMFTEQVIPQQQKGINGGSFSNYSMHTEKMTSASTSKFTDNDQFNLQNVKIEPTNSDDDTDEASDNDDETVYGVNQMKSNQSDSIRKNAHRRKKLEQANQSQQYEQQTIKTEPVALEEERLEMVVAEAIDVKDEPIDNDDEPIQSDQETDDESDHRKMTHHNYNTNDKKTRRVQDQMQSTSRQNVDMTSNYSNTQRQPEKPLNQVGSKSIQSKNTVDGNKLLRFNNFESESRSSQSTYIEINDDDDINLDELGDELEVYVKNLEKQFDEELEQLKKIKMEELTKDELKDLTQRLERLRRKREAFLVQKAKENVERSEKEKEKMRDEFMHNLFGLKFNVERLENLLLNRPSDLTESKSNSSNESKKCTYNEFMKKPKSKTEYQKTTTKHYVSVVLNEHIHQMQSANKIHEVPQKAIDHVRSDKDKIKKIVDRYLMPYYNKGTISKNAYSTICKKITQRHFESNDYDSESIQRRVGEMVKCVVKAKQEKLVK